MSDEISRMYKQARINENEEAARLDDKINKIGVLIGRFQPLHNEHVHLITSALEQVDHLIIIVGSAHQDRSLKNPFSGYERIIMIRNSISATNKISIIQQEDCPGDNSRWAREIQQKIMYYLNQHQYLDSRNLYLIGHRKDESTFYVDLFPWKFIDLPKTKSLNATDIRNSYFGGEPITNWGKDLPLPVIEFLVNFKNTESFGILIGIWNHYVTTKTNS